MAGVSGVERVRAALAAAGNGDIAIRTFAETTRTAAEAAAAIGCDVAQIAKSLVFRTRPGDRPVLIIASGRNRVDERAVANRFRMVLGDAQLARADAAFVRDRTGFAIGGVAPVGHREPPVVLVDRDLLSFSEIWAAAGSPFAVFSLTPTQLVAMTAGHVGAIGAEVP